MNSQAPWPAREERRSGNGAVVTLWIRAAALLVAAAGCHVAAGQEFPSRHEVAIPAEWPGPVFLLRQDYPAALPPPEAFPWKRIDFRSQPAAYLNSVLRYAYEGNIAVDWQVQRNRRRAWYHAPWLHWHDAGREFVHGMTRERTSRPHELHPHQVDAFQNWAISVYNDRGGYVLGRVWRGPHAPEARAAAFPDGSVMVKLLFTQAPVAQVPYLRNAPEWQANIHTLLTPNGKTPRHIGRLRLLQIDVAVRDERPYTPTGWVFGTFIYNADAPGATRWDRMVPVGVMWGNDEGITPARVNQGFRLRETALNPAARPLAYKLGWAGRLNGPVDNPVSACLSCHSTAEVPQGPNVPKPASSDADRLYFFRNIKAPQSFTRGAISTDFSLQISLGISYFRAAHGLGSGPLTLWFRAVNGGRPAAIPREGFFLPTAPHAPIIRPR